MSRVTALEGYIDPMKHWTSPDRSDGYVNFRNCVSPIGLCSAPTLLSLKYFSYRPR